MRLRFVTSTPQDIRRGSGTYVGIHVLAKAVHRVEPFAETAGSHDFY